MDAIFPASMAVRLKRTTIISFAVLSGLLSGTPSLLNASDPDSTGLEFFEKKIRPIFVEQCYKCHSKDAEKLKGGLLLDTRDGLLKGGDTGPAIVPGDSEKSLLIKTIRYADEALQMPPRKRGGKLADQQIADLEAWVKMGAPDPRTDGASVPKGP